MDELDYKILRELENDFPLNEKPYEFIADKLKIPLDQLWKRLQDLTTNGVIRRMGVSLDSRKIGFCSTLATIKVNENQVKRAAKIIGQFPEVTHSYLRNNEFNIWFTIIACDKERIEAILEQICSALSLDESQMLNLPVKRLFKLNARFSISSRD
ncbi:MAG: Lrp/AsnC family transcriptional regulator [Planctomycetota bacterium]|jgi:DNA-binding Lrp family transcriptional regulator